MQRLNKVSLGMVEEMQQELEIILLFPLLHVVFLFF